MKIERIRKSHKKEILIGGLITICLIGAITITTTKARYKTTERLEHVITGTIKYTPYDFKIMAMYKSDDGETYTEIENRMPSSGYAINESKSYCTLDNKNHDTEAILKTIDGNHIISNLAKSDKCYLYFDKEKSGSDQILANVAVNENIPNFTNIATTDEGVFKAEDGMYGGTSYYWRGTVENNYVKFADFCWRIVRINGDKSIRLIYDGKMCHANGVSTVDSFAVQMQAYDLSPYQSEHVGYTYVEGNQKATEGNESNLKVQNDTWYNGTIVGTDATKVADGKYCNDRNVASGYSWSSKPNSTFYYAGYDRSGAKSSSVTPTLSCPSDDVYTIKAGAITMDEVVMAGGKWAAANSNYYLYNGNYYWTMSPGYWNYHTNTNYNARVFEVASNGGIDGNNASFTRGIRPVINLKANTQFQTGGNGTLDNPYVVQ